MDKKGEPKVTNVWDFLINFLSWILNLLKLEKIVCIVIVYLLVRDGIILSKVKENTDVSSLLIDTKLINTIIANDDSLVVIMGCAIVALIIILLIVVLLVIPMYKKEIDRLSKIRSTLMHGEDENKLHKHRSSGKV